MNKTYHGIEQVQRAKAHDDRRHGINKRRAYKSLAAYENAKRKGAK